MSKMNLIVTIVSRGKGADAGEVYHDYHILSTVMRGHGTASSAMMDLLGLDEPEKDILLGVSLSRVTPLVLAGLSAKMNFLRPGGGIAFAVPLSGVSRAISDHLSTGENEENGESREEEYPMNEEKSYDLIIAEVDSGATDIVVKAATEAGVHGGTVAKTRDISGEEKKIFGITVQPEKEIVLMLVPSEIRNDAMKAICSAVLAETGEHAQVFSLPVSAVAGLKKTVPAPEAEKETAEEQSE